MSPLITVAAGGPEVPPGVYPVTLVSIEGPKTIVPNSGPNAGKEIDILSWNFAIDEGEYEGTEIEATSSTASGPRSKLYGFLTALFAGQAPPAGTQLEADDLIGRRALATIERTESGWMRIVNLGAMPATFNIRAQQSQPVPATSRIPGRAPGPGAARRAVGIRQQVAQPAAAADDLPF